MPATAPPNSKLKLAVTASALSEDPRRAPQSARQLGFSGLQFSGGSPALKLTDLSASGRREFRHLLSAQDIQLVGLSADLGGKGLGPGADVDRLLAQLDRLLEAAKGMLAPLVCVDVGPLPAPPRQERPKPKVTPEMAGLLILPTSSALSAIPAPESTNLHEIPTAVDPTFVSQVDAAMMDLGQRADRYGVTVAFRSDLASFAALERALRSADCPWFGIDLDPVALLRDGSDGDEFFSHFGPLVRHVRGRDASAGPDRRTKPAAIGRGDTDWPQLLAKLDDAGYHGWITVDPFELPDRTVAAAAGRERIIDAMKS